MMRVRDSTENWKAAVCIYNTICIYNLQYMYNTVETVTCVLVVKLPFDLLTLLFLYRGLKHDMVGLNLWHFEGVQHFFDLTAQYALKHCHTCTSTVTLTATCILRGVASIDLTPLRSKLTPLGLLPLLWSMLLIDPLANQRISLGDVFLPLMISWSRTRRSRSKQSISSWHWMRS